MPRRTASPAVAAPPGYKLLAHKPCCIGSIGSEEAPCRKLTRPSYSRGPPELRLYSPAQTMGRCCRTRPVGSRRLSRTHAGQHGLGPIDMFQCRRGRLAEARRLERARTARGRACARALQELCGIFRSIARATRRNSGSIGLVRLGIPSGLQAPGRSLPARARHARSPGAKPPGQDRSRRHRSARFDTGIARAVSGYVDPHFSGGEVRICL